MKSAEMNARSIETLNARCFRWVESPTGEEKRGPFDPKGAASAVRQYVAAQVAMETDGKSDPGECVGRGIDGDLWVFEGGVWQHGKRRIHEVIVTLLGSDFTTSRHVTIERFLAGSSELPVIEGASVPAWLNFTNGMYHWETDTFHSHNSAVLSTVQLGCAWNPDATCDRWLSFLSEVLPPDALETFQEVAGYLMMSGEPLHKAFMFNGTGRNGKGTVLHVIETLLGAQNVSHISMQSLGGNRFSSAGLFGRLANIVGDMSASFVKETDTFKSATGGDSIDAERKGRDAFSFTPFASHVFSTNRLPMFADSSVGFLDRWIVIPFPYTVPADKRDKDLKYKLCEPAELEGIAVWAAAGLRRLMARGRFELAPSLLEAKEEFAVAVNPVRAFLRECAKREPGQSVRTSELYSVYRAWMVTQGRKGAGKQEFYAEVETLSVTRAKSHGIDVFRDIALIKQAEDLLIESVW